MIFTETILKGAFLIKPEKIEDNRGFFARTWCQNEFTTCGLQATFVQCNISFNKKRGTLRGMHYQVEPYRETKLVRCTRGAIYDVIIDIRPESSTYRRWIGVELTAENSYLLYIPTGFAHGFQSLVDETEVFYHMSEFYMPQCSRGLRHDDPAFAVHWPLQVSEISSKDKTWPFFEKAFHQKR